MDDDDHAAAALPPDPPPPHSPADAVETPVVVADATTATAGDGDAAAQVHEGEYGVSGRVDGDASPPAGGDAPREHAAGVGGDVGPAADDDGVREGVGASEAVEPMPATPDIVLQDGGGGGAVDGEGGDGDGNGGDMVVQELAVIPEGGKPAGVIEGVVPEGDVDIGEQLDERKEESACIGEDPGMPSAQEGFDGQIGEGAGGGAEHADCGDDMDEQDAKMGQDNGEDAIGDGKGALMDAAAVAGDGGSAAGDEEGTSMGAAAMTADGDNASGGDEDKLMDTVAMTGEGEKEERIGRAGDDTVDEEDMQMGTINMAGDDNGEEGVRIAGDNLANEEGMQVDTAAITGDNRKEEENCMAGIEVANEETQMDIVATAGDDNEEEDTVPGAAGDDNEEEEAGPAGGDMDNEEEEAGPVGGDMDNEEEEADTADDKDTAEEGRQMDTIATAGDDEEEEEVRTGGDNVPEEEAAQINEDDDDDEPPPVMAKKGGGRRKRGRPSSKAQAVAKPSGRRKDDEEVCFICFDGGELVVCDRRGCPKVYHASCVNRDNAFFRSKGRWNCGWHICSNCQKNAHYMCYTCTYSLCKGCIKGIEFFGIRENKGFCGTCMNTVMLIENKEEATDPMDGVDFDDTNSWWYLFKDYWLDLKGKLSLTVEEISVARSKGKGSSLVTRGNGPTELPGANDGGVNSDSSSGHHLESDSSKKRGRKRLKKAASEDSSKGKERTRKSSKRGVSGRRDPQSSEKKARKTSRLALRSEHQSKESESVGTSTSSPEEVSWASKELLDFVAHMRNGDQSMLSQFDVQALLLAYIKQKDLRDPRRRSQIVCDSLLQNLFGKPRVGHFEMLKLLESHFLMNEVSPMDADDNHGGVVDPDPSQDADGNSEASIIMSSEKRRKSRKKYEQRGLQSNLDDYAAIDSHNISLMYLRRNLMEELIDDVDIFNEKVVASFVRIRISGTGQRQDIYRLVQIVGTGSASEKYKCGKKTTDVTLEIINLDKREVITIDIISNQEFTEDECERLKQSIKCGLLPRLTVGEVQEKARVLRAVKVNDWIESEKLRLGHLRDRASDMGRRKELRECVEKLQLLSTPEERARRLSEEPEIHADSTMDPDYESPEEEEQDTERNSFNRSRGSFFRKDSSASGKGDSWNAAAQRDSKASWESNRNTWAESTPMESSSTLTRKFPSHGEHAGYTSNLESSNISANTASMEANMGNNQHGLSGVSSETLVASEVTAAAATAAAQPTVNESEKIWHYVDPSGKVQGPFSMTQLRKWNSNGYFPPSLRIWKAIEKQDDSILLTDALVGKFERDLPPWEPPVGSSSQTDKTYLRSNSDTAARPKVGEHGPKPVAPSRSQSFPGRVGQSQDYDTRNMGSTAIQPSTLGYYGIQNSQAAYANQQSTVGSWNASSNQYGTAVNPATPSQAVTGGFSAAQNIAVAGNIGQTTSLMVTVTGSSAEINPQSSSQNQIATVLPQSEIADGGETKLGDSSDGRLSSSVEGLGPVGHQPEATQLNIQQLEGLKQTLSNSSLNHSLAQQESSISTSEPTNANTVAASADGRNQLAFPDAGNSATPSQLTSTPSTEPVQPSQANLTGSDNPSSGWAMPAQVANTAVQAQGTGNMTWGAALQGNANMGWGMMGQPNMNMAWGTQGTANYNMALATQTQPNAIPNMGWVTPNLGNTNMNMMWAATGQATPNAAAMMGVQMQGLATAPWGSMAQTNASPYPGMGAQMGNLNQNVNWGTPMQGNAATNPGNGAGQGSMNMNWNSPNGNPSWNNQQRESGGRLPGQGDDFHGSNSGGRSSWNSHSRGDGICLFLKNGHCKKGNQCNYYHPPANDGHPSRNDRQFDRERHFDRRNDRHNDRRNDRQFDRAPSRERR